jgi:hypothetical protein
MIRLGRGDGLESIEASTDNICCRRRRLEKDSDSDIVGYAADDEDLPLIGKKFGTWGMFNGRK